jgi:hypothetical protein
VKDSKTREHMTASNLKELLKSTTLTTASRREVDSILGSLDSIKMDKELNYRDLVSIAISADNLDELEYLTGIFK